VTIVEPVDSVFARKFIARLHGAVNAHDANAIAALCTDDIEWIDPASADALHGRDAVARFHREGMFAALPDVKIELIDGPYVAGDAAGIAVRTRIRGTMTGPLNPPGFAPTGSTVDFVTAEFSHLRDGLLAHHVVMINMLDLAQQIGAVPRSGSIGERLGVTLQHWVATTMKWRNRNRSEQE
jgi:ketosteroid isomerase-like protein